MKKAALAPKMFVILTVMMILLIMFISFLYSFKQTGVNLTQVQECKDSITAIATRNKVNKTSVGVDRQEFFDTVQCKTQEIEITTKDNQEKNSQLAKILKDSWYMMNRGQSRLLTKQTVDSNICIILARIKFKDKILDGLLKYLDETNAPNYDGTYLEYLTNDRQSSINELKRNYDFEKDSSVLWSDEYVLAFYYYDHPESHKFDFTPPKYYFKYLYQDEDNKWASVMFLAPLDSEGLRNWRCKILV